jgi:hypothetical protein
MAKVWWSSIKPCQIKRVALRHDPNSLAPLSLQADGIVWDNPDTGTVRIEWREIHAIFVSEWKTRRDPNKGKYAATLLGPAGVIGRALSLKSQPYNLFAMVTFRCGSPVEDFTFLVSKNHYEVQAIFRPIIESLSASGDAGTGDALQ